MRWILPASLMVAVFAFSTPPTCDAAGPLGYGSSCGSFGWTWFGRLHQHGPLYNYGPYYGYAPFEPYGPWNAYLQYNPNYFAQPGHTASHSPGRSWCGNGQCGKCDGCAHRGSLLPQHGVKSSGCSSCESGASSPQSTLPSQPNSSYPYATYPNIGSRVTAYPYAVAVQYYGRYLTAPLSDHQPAVVPAFIP